MKEDMINAVIFDMDGVLIDTEKHYYAAWREAARMAGFDFQSDASGVRSENPSSPDLAQ